VEALQDAKPLLAHLRRAGVGNSLLTDLASAERAARDVPDIRPWNPEQEIHAKIDLFDLANFRASVTREMLFKTLAGSGSEDCNRVSFHEDVREAEGRQIIKIHKLTQLPDDAPTLILDADADPVITECVAPGARFTAIDIQPEAEVVQVSDRTLSNTWLLDPDLGPDRRRQILNLIRREVERGNNRGVLVVSTKAVLAALHRDAGNEVAANDDAGLMTPLFGAEPRWFGPRMQGVNDFEDFGTVVLIGRLQPPHGDIEDATRCLFGDDPDPIIATVLGRCQSNQAGGSSQTADSPRRQSIRIRTSVQQLS
jgi:hypothetical protein